MATVLVYMVLVGRTWAPQWVQAFPDAQACARAAEAFKGPFVFATCVPQLK